ncbi:DMT family transporter [Bacillus thermotolerans]|uniref:Permease of the drug/metabolite transporter (DMT) superfamily n=1 Tax=Bacillus thermotolerans TaxID=1221996 RepID=A0A0F5HJ57_BACTR|nr:DMT family transporter [Bacillus thermotolerans]KKB33050.1 Permease of the drug/metabolite transporter (DMT) superfamily [Bacillus thermotolerans]KKB34252.1 Permease of the drug/metabolite transporter (DMT) superfamily [Bacillus thermotolerans]KKB40111.1 Permease of the drug/metabolite transporter (DMT) superfamily [Bacillus thermotolerans]
MKTPVGLLLTISMIAISFAAIFVKWSDAPASIISMYRMYLACALLLPMVWLKREEFKKLSRKDWLFLAIAGIFLALHFALWFGSLKLTTVASSTIILALQPIVALVGGFLFYKERTNLATLLLIGISIIGVAMIGWGDLGLSKTAILGDILSFLSVVAVVGYLLIGQNKVKTISHWIYSFCVFLFAALALNIYNLLTSTPVTGYGAHEWGIFFLLAVFPTIAHVIYNLLLNYVNTTTISMSILGEPVGATILAALILDERVTDLQLMGGFFVLSGVLLFLIQQRNTSIKEEAGSY